MSADLGGRMETYHNGPWEFPVLDGGPSDAPGDRTVILLHGFPQTAAAWSRVAPRLHDAGLRTVAPENRGTAPGARPTGRAAYRMDHLVSDVLALVEAVGGGPIHLVGHDWGAGIAWEVAARHPEHIRSLTALSVPHPAALAWSMGRSGQMLRSSYMLPMQVPFVERLGSAAIRRGALHSLGLPTEHEAAYRERFSDPDALAGALGLYRGMLAGAAAGGRDGAAGDIDVPTTFVWGRRDPYLGRPAAEHTGGHCREEYRFVDLDADHWLPEKQPGPVAEEIIRRVGVR